MDVIQERLGGILLSFHASLKKHKQAHGPPSKPDAALPVILHIRNDLEDREDDVRRCCQGWNGGDIRNRLDSSDSPVKCVVARDLFDGSEYPDGHGGHGIKETPESSCGGLQVICRLESIDREAALRWAVRGNPLV